MARRNRRKKNEAPFHFIFYTEDGGVTWHSEQKVVDDDDIWTRIARRGF